MEDQKVTAREKSCATEEDFETTDRLKERLERLLMEAAEVEVALSRADGTIRGIPHYSVIENRAHELGKRLSREVQQRQMSELAASQAVTAKCPECGAATRLEARRRTVKSVDGNAALQEMVGHCRRCRRDFFPDARDVGP